MKIKLFALIFISFLTVGFCFSEVITLWTSWEDESFYKNMAEKYSNETGIDIEVTNFPKLSEKLNLSLKTGELPDISMISDNMISSLYYSEKTVHLSTDDLKSVGSFSSKDVEGFSYLNEILGIPFYSDENVAVINIDVFEELGIDIPPSDYTFEDLKTIRDKFVAAGKDVIGWEFFYPFILYSYLQAYGDLLIDDVPSLNLDENKKVLNEIKGFFDDGLAVRLERGIQPEKFIDEEIGIFLQGSFILPLLQDKNFIVYSLPRLDKNVNIPTLIDAKGFSLFNSEKKEICLDFIKFIFENGDEFCLNNLKVPLYKTDNIPEKLAALHKVHETGIYFQKNPKLQSIYKKVMKQTLQAVYSGDIGVEEGLDSAQEFALGNW
ncbi:MAG: hypothetical protein PWQ77_1620 [Kosmotogales bacterium]|nr:hypothetical protein [Kosmotogales bacterium]